MTGSTQLGLTKTTHEYAVYQLLATAIGWRVWRKFLPAEFADHKLLLTRAVRLLTETTIRPAHARPPHPTWVGAVRQIIRFLLRASFPHLVQVLVLEGSREVDILGFSAASYTGLAVHEASLLRLGVLPRRKCPCDTGEAPSNGSSSVTNFNSHFWSCCLAIFESKNKKH